MNRRQYLRAGISIACCTTVAGCLDEVTTAVESDDESVTPATDRTGERALARSVGRLNEAAIALEAGSKLELERDEVEFDAEDPLELIASARDVLDTAEEELDDDRQPDIDELRAYADVLAALVDVTATVTDDSLEDEFDAVSAALADRRLEDASTTVDELIDDFDDAEGRFETAESTLKELDADRLTALSAVDPAEIEAGASTLETVLTSMVALVTALESTLDGYECLERGQNHADDESYDSATASFEDGESAFETSMATLEEGREDAPSGLESHFETGLCRTNHLTTAAGYFIEFTEAAMNNDRVTARRRQNEAEAAVEDADDC